MLFWAWLNITAIVGVVKCKCSYRHGYIQIQLWLNMDVIVGVVKYNLLWQTKCQCYCGHD